MMATKCPCIKLMQYWFIAQQKKNFQSSRYELGNPWRHGQCGQKGVSHQNLNGSVLILLNFEMNITTMLIKSKEDDITLE